MEIAKNGFTEGIVSDADTAASKNSTLLYAENVRIFNEGDTNFILTNINGKDVVSYEKDAVTYQAVLPANSFVLGKAVKNGICYIALLVDDGSTSYGEIGTFPSPFYNKDVAYDHASNKEGDFIYKYAPLRNFTLTDSDPIEGFRAFRAPFEFDKRKLEIHLQEDYDLSVNIILIDGKNDARIINSGFQVLPDNKFKRIERVGLSTNEYNESNFNVLTSLQLRSPEILKINFNGVEKGGVVKAGMYKYYFTYSLEDGNETEVLGESFNVAVNVGSKINECRGGVDEEPTNKRVRFTLSNIDTNFKKVNVYFSFTRGIDGKVTSFYRIEKGFSITSTSMEIIHTGFEPVLDVLQEDLNISYNNFTAPKTATQAKGYLFLANFRTKETDLTDLIAFAKGITVTKVEKKIDVDIDNTSDLLNRSAKFDFYRGGYYNPNNVYYYTGYMAEESYSFLFHYIMEDGSVTDGFPVTGIVNPTTQTYVGSPTYDSDGWDTGGNLTTRGQNNKGIYRFPKKTDNFNKDANGRYGKVFGVRFLMPDLPTPIGTKGGFFTRGTRKPDAIIQGVINPAVKVKSTGSGNYDYDSSWLDVENDYSSVPLPSLLCGVTKHAEADGGNPGVLYSARFKRCLTVDEVDSASNKRILDYVRMGFYSADTSFNSKVLSDLDNKTFYSRPLFDFSMIGFMKHTFNKNDETSGFRLSGIKAHRALGSFLGNSTTIEVETAVVNDDVEDAENKGFVSKVTRALFRSATVNAEFHFTANFNSYLGLSSEDLNISHWIRQASLFETGTSIAAHPAITAYAESDLDLKLMDEDAPVLYGRQVNLYSSNSGSNGGIRTNSQVKAVYNNIDTDSYTPITQRMLWTEMVTQVDAYNGDTYVASYMSEIYRPNDDNGAANSQGAHNFLHQVIVQESTYCPVFKEKAGNASFMPFKRSENYTGSDFGVARFYVEIPEAKALNNAADKVNSDKVYISKDLLSPYILTQKRNTVLVSSKQISGSFTNGYRRFFGSSEQSYGTENGEIIKLVTDKGDLTVIMETGIGVIQVEERTLVGSGADAVYVNSGQILSSYMTMITERVGSKHQFSIINTGANIAGFDETEFRLWVASKQRGLKIISDQRINSILRKYISVYRNKVNTLDKDVYSYYNVKNNEIVFVFYNRNDVANSFCVVYNEITDKFYSFSTEVPYEVFNINDEVYHIDMDSLQSSNRNIYKKEAALTYLPFKVKFSVSDKYELYKIFDNLKVISNNVYPTSIIYTVEGAKATQTIVPRTNGNIALANAVSRQGVIEIQIPRVDEITNQSATESLPDSQVNAESLISELSRLKGKELIITMEYNSDKQVRLISINTQYRIAR